MGATLAEHENRMDFHKTWIEQSEASKALKDKFGTQKALEYLVGEKFINFLDAAETNADFRAEIPMFVAEIKTIFERGQLAEYLETARQTEPFDLSMYEGEDPEDIETERQSELRQSAAELWLVERAREWLLEE